VNTTIDKLDNTKNAHKIKSSQVLDNVMQEPEGTSTSAAAVPDSDASKLSDQPKAKGDHILLTEQVLSLPPPPRKKSAALVYEPLLPSVETVVDLSGSGPSTPWRPHHMRTNTFGVVVPNLNDKIFASGSCK
jgi:hypothetical protein